MFRRSRRGCRCRFRPGDTVEPTTWTLRTGRCRCQYGRAGTLARGLPSSASSVSHFPPAVSVSVDKGLRRAFDQSKAMLGLFERCLVGAQLMEVDNSSDHGRARNSAHRHHDRDRCWSRMQSLWAGLVGTSYWNRCTQRRYQRPGRHCRFILGFPHWSRLRPLAVSAHALRRGDSRRDRRVTGMAEEVIGLDGMGQWCTRLHTERPKAFRADQRPCPPRKDPLLPTP